MTDLSLERISHRCPLTDLPLTDLPQVPPARALVSVAHAENDDVTYTGASDGRVLVWRFPGECVRAQQLHRPDAAVLALAVRL